MTQSNKVDYAKIMALKLSSLDKDDFEWVFKRLNEAAKEKLTPLVEEIREVGLTVEPQDIGHFSLDQGRDENHLSDLENTINMASYEQLKRVFDGEPIQLFYYLAAIKDWSWKSNPDFILEMKQLREFPIVNAEQIQLHDSLISNVAKRLKTQNLINDIH